MSSNYKLVRLIRTPSSEVYMIWEADERVGQADIHYAEGLVHCTILLEQTLERQPIEALIAQLDDDVVSSYLPDFDREDFFVNVFSGEEILSYSDSDDDDDTQDD
ncbi:MAG: hypothetical protein IT204_05945 [Fimbriimonadaceae bacterium]|nr:hypothetical protein [Fimbriimonadaceae bacterium]